MNETVQGGPWWSAVFKPKFGLIWVLVLMAAYFALSSSVFRTPGNLMEVLRQSGIIAIMVLGLTWIVATGEIDVSFPDVAAFSGVMTAVLIASGLSWAATVLITLLAGAAFGVLSGLLVVRFKFPSLIATIATAGIAKATASMLGKGQVIHITRAGPELYQLVYGKILGVPILFLITMAIYLICRFFQDRTTMGQHLYALGENRQATTEAGIEEGKILTWLYILSALLAAIAGILLTATLSSGNPRIGGSYFLDGLTVVFLGTMVIKTGQPNLIGTLIGVVILAVLSNGLTHLGLPYYIGTIIKGLLLVFGVVVVTVAKTRRSGRHILEVE